MRLLLGNSIGTFTFRYDSYMRQRIGFGTILDEATRFLDTAEQAAYNRVTVSRRRLTAFAERGSWQNAPKTTINP